MVQIFSQDGAIHVNGAAVAYIKNVRLTINYTKVKAYDDAGDPDVLEYGDATYSFTAEFGYQNSTIIDLVLGRNKVDVILYPDGAGAGNDKFTLASCILDTDVGYARMATIIQNLSGEGIGVTKGVAP